MHLTLEDKKRIIYTIVIIVAVILNLRFCVSLSNDESNSVKVNLPSCPLNINEFGYDGEIQETCKITDIKYEISSDNIYIYFSGEKTYDAKGNDNNTMFSFDYKLYDSNRTVVEEGIFISPTLKVGDKFKSEKEYCWGCIEENETYTLEIINETQKNSIELKLPELPCEISYYSSYSKKIYSTCKITNITYTSKGNNLSLYFSGEKTYDYSGNTNSDNCYIPYKLYDSKGNVVSYGTFYSPDLKVGETFVNKKESIWDSLTPGETYRLELLDLK